MLTLFHVLFAMQLLESCVSNCGKEFQLELTKPAFHVQVKEIMTSVGV